MYNIIRTHEDKYGKSEILTDCFKDQSQVEKFLDKEFKNFRNDVFQKYTYLRKQIKSGINEKLTVIETDNSISVEYKIRDQDIIWEYAIREANYIKSEYHHYPSKTYCIITYKVIEQTND